MAEKYSLPEPTEGTPAQINVALGKRVINKAHELLVAANQDRRRNPTECASEASNAAFCTYRRQNVQGVHMESEAAKKRDYRRRNTQKLMMFMCTYVCARCRNAQVMRPRAKIPLHRVQGGFGCCPCPWKAQQHIGSGEKGPS